jgi:hypothetical protein
MRFALVLCLLALTAPACDPPWAGPSLPAGAAWVDFTQLSPGPVECGPRPAIFASTSIDGLRQRVIAACARPSACAQNIGSCWQDVRDQSGYVYVAVLISPTCNTPTKDSVAQSSRAIYIVHWIGHAQGVCNLMMAVPQYGLFVISRSGLQAGSVKVELQIQTEGGSTDTIDTELDLT